MSWFECMLGKLCSWIGLFKKSYISNSTNSYERRFGLNCYLYHSRYGLNCIFTYCSYTRGKMWPEVSVGKDISNEKYENQERWGPIIQPQFGNVDFSK